MLALTKTLTTGGIAEFCLRVPAPLAEAVEKALEGIRALLHESGDLYNDEGERLEVTTPAPPCRVLSGFRKRDGLTQEELAERLGVKQQHVSEMENGKRPISKKTAQKLAELFNTTYKTFL